MICIIPVTAHLSLKGGGSKEESYGKPLDYIIATAKDSLVSSTFNRIVVNRMLSVEWGCVAAIH